MQHDNVTSASSAADRRLTCSHTQLLNQFTQLKTRMHGDLTGQRLQGTTQQRKLSALLARGRRLPRRWRLELERLRRGRLVLLGRRRVRHRRRLADGRRRRGCLCAGARPGGRHQLHWLVCGARAGLASQQLNYRYMTRSRWKGPFSEQKLKNEHIEKQKIGHVVLFILSFD